MAISVIQAVSTQALTGSAQVNLTVGSGQAPALLVVVIGGYKGGSLFTIGASDGTNTYTQNGSTIYNTFNGGVGILSAANVGQGSYTITGSITGGADQMSLIALHATGIALASPFDVTAGQAQTSVTTTSSGATSTRAQADEVLIGACLCGQADLYPPTAGSNLAWAIPTNGSVQTPGQDALAIEYVIVSATGTEAAEFTQLSNTALFATIIATYKGLVVPSPRVMIRG